MNDEQKRLAEKVLDQVERQPESLDMATWLDFGNLSRVNWKTGEGVEGCGTTRCMAGWAVHFASRSDEDEYDARKRIARESGLDSPSNMTVGAHLLGLNPSEAERLFLELAESEAVDFLRARIARS